MSRRRLQRLATCVFMALALLFAQLVLAGYVCPWQADQTQGMAKMAEMAAAGESCEGMDAEQPVLCLQYAADPGKTFEAVKLPAASLPAVVLVLEIPRLLNDDRARAAPTATALESRPPPDPLFLSTLRLRV